MKNALLLVCCCLLSFEVVAEEKVKVGVSLPLSGPIAEYGYAARNAIALAQQERKDFFQNIEFIFEDDVYEAKKGVTNFRKFVTLDKVDLIFSWGAEPTLAIVPLAERHQIPLVTQSPLTSVSSGKKYIIRFQYNDDKHGEVITEYFQQKGIQKIGMIMSELSFFELLSAGIEKHLKDAQHYELISSVLPSELDFKSILLRKNLQEYDIIGVYLLPAQLKLFYRQAKELGLDLNTFGTTTFESTSVLKDVMPLLDGIPYTHSANSEEFLVKYEKVFGSNMHIGYAAGVYDFAILLGKLVREGKIISGGSAESIIEAFSTVKPFEGAAGKVQVVRSKELGTYFDFELIVKKLVSGKIQTEYVPSEAL